MISNRCNVVQNLLMLSCEQVLMIVPRILGYLERPFYVSNRVRKLNHFNVGMAIRVLFGKQTSILFKDLHRWRGVKEDEGQQLPEAGRSK